MALDGFPTELGEPQQSEILVIGGGLAGVCATVAAARLGRTVTLVQDRPVLGGNASSEHKVNISGADCSGSSLTRFSRETGIIDELALEVFHRAPSNATVRYVQDWVLYEAVTREPNATLFLNSKAVDAVVAPDGSIRGVTVLQVSTEKSFALEAKIVIDCSGDGRIAAAAGAEFRMGREAAGEFGESMAPEKADDHTMGSSIEFVCRDMGRPVPFTAPSFARYFENEDALPFRSPRLEFPDSEFEGSGWWWLEYGGQVNTIDDNEHIRDELIAVLFGLWDYLKNRSDQPLENYALEWIGALPGRRESRRFIGDHVLTENDVRANRKFEDAVGYSGWPIDLHPPMGIYDPAPPSTHVFRSDYVTVPLRCLYSKNVPNLFFAGRNISATHVGMGTTRVMATCAILGQAVGTAAHLCLGKGVSPRALAGGHFRDVQQLLLKGDCYIPGIRNEDDKDLARGARATASSDAPLAIEPDDSNGVELAGPCAQLVAISDGRLDSVSLLLSSVNDSDTELSIVLTPAAHINDIPANTVTADARAVVPPGGPHWVRFETEVADLAGELVWIIARQAPGIIWQGCKTAPVGTVRSMYHEKSGGGSSAEASGKGVFGTPEGNWRSSKGALCVRLDPVSRPYTADNVLSGVARPEDGTHIWISDPDETLPQWLELCFEVPSRINTVLLTFDDDLDRNIYHPPAWGGTIGEMNIPTLVKDYRLYAKTAGTWREVAHVSDNHQRRNRLSFDEMATEAIRIEVLATRGDPSARIYEVRAYME